ncbi:hypothetical protein Ccrd_026430 [Cynara cardunculus var. scolymus]|uniref:Uncharacterized protein n=1 Tax=Cynara cardunculus var. scolymus TaxID=59895 RepID=A0A103XDC9_CYNCS|nr:hypothetical protein Ccrd_026430 [Cynara cardunculus var. scolymus]
MKFKKKRKREDLAKV